MVAQPFVAKEVGLLDEAEVGASSSPCGAASLTRLTDRSAGRKGVRLELDVLEGVSSPETDRAWVAKDFAEAFLPPLLHSRRADLAIEVGPTSGSTLGARNCA